MIIIFMGAAVREIVVTGNCGVTPVVCAYIPYGVCVAGKCPTIHTMSSFSNSYDMKMLFLTLCMVQLSLYRTYPNLPWAPPLLHPSYMLTKLQLTLGCWYFYFVF